MKAVKGRFFFGGAHVPDRKSLAKDAPIEELPEPQEVTIALLQSLGKPAIACVSVGDTVAKGQLIAKADGAISSDVFASISGTVTEIKALDNECGNRDTFIVIKGDGERKLEDLIWADDKAVSDGKLFSKINFRSAGKVLDAGETFALAPIGSRIRGANFVSRPELRAGTLADAIDRLADACGDVHYLVLDIRAANDEALAAGTGIRITGVKGAGAVVSSIYDGYVRMGMAYSRAFRQMNYCFSIGAEIRDEHGAKPAISAFRLFEIWGTARGRSDNYVKMPHDVDP